MIRQRILFCLHAICCLIVTQPANAATTNSAAIAEAASAALSTPECLEYCVTGYCISIICTPFGCTLQYSALISHRSPDLVVSAYKEPGENTWSEASSLYGALAKGAANAIVGFGKVEAGGGPNYVARQERDAQDEKKPGQKRPFANLHFKEVSVIGSPTIEATNAIEGTCEAEAEPFEAYVQSEFDAFEWRWGLLEKLYPASWILGLREISQTPLTTWGGVHPRMGFVKSEHPARAAAVGAQRAIDIATRLHQPHVYRPINGAEGAQYESDEKTDKWQMVSPETDKVCYAFGSATDYITHRVDDEEQYAFLYWQKLQCCPYAKGVVIARVETHSCSGEKQE